MVGDVDVEGNSVVVGNTRHVKLNGIEKYAKIDKVNEWRGGV